MISLAAEDLAGAVKYYEAQSAGLGADFLDEFDASVERICHCPEAWRKVINNHRRHLFRRFPYAVLYYYDRKEIIISGVMNLRMNPEKQRQRVDSV
ncbi:MAG: type II toxin-antitoxin system RelE/ParE family toxin [Chlorobiales bacterium]|nr:type II toxin-antitoxin system RelE/ParE family toxin [Chlorobiales bacterium]